LAAVQKLIADEIGKKLSTHDVGDIERRIAERRQRR
jgi:hypothetical protein